MGRPRKSGLPPRLNKNGAGYFYFNYPAKMGGSIKTVGLGRDQEKAIAIANELNATLGEIGKEKLEKRTQAELLRAKTGFSLDPSGLLDLSFLRSKSEIYDRVAGVYFLLSDGEVVYVGQSVDCNARLSAHFREGTKAFDSSYILRSDPRDLIELEALYIQKFRPKFNLDLPDPKRKTAWGLTQHISAIEVKF